jgi:hypothetical protein
VRPQARPEAALVLLLGFVPETRESHPFSLQLEGAPD